MTLEVTCAGPEVALDEPKLTPPVGAGATEGTAAAVAGAGAALRAMPLADVPATAGAATALGTAAGVWATALAGRATPVREVATGFDGPPKTDAAKTPTRAAAVSRPPNWITVKRFSLGTLVMDSLQIVLGDPSTRAGGTCTGASASKRVY
jgi:hypothetical protein